MNFNKTYTLKEAQKTLEQYCAYQERTHKEVEQKLQKMGMVPEASDAIILYLLQHDFLNEERFAKAYVSGKFRIKKWGRIKIMLHLRQKGISTANIAIGLGEIDSEDYFETLRNLALKKHRDLSTTLMAHSRKQKVIRYLQQKGYELNLIYQVMHAS